MMERHIIKLAVTPKAKAAIESMCDRYGMSQIEMASRLYQWACTQDEVVQAAILGILPEDVAPDVAKLVLKRMAAGEEGAKPLKQAAKKAKAGSHATSKLPGARPRGNEKKRD
ncbi:MAG: hypothetical protein WD294_08930 [Phycisphaeraceae bacterium]